MSVVTDVQPVTRLVEALRHKTGGSGFDSQCCP